MEEIVDRAAISCSHNITSLSKNKTLETDKFEESTASKGQLITFELEPDAYFDDLREMSEANIKTASVGLNPKPGDPYRYCFTWHVVKLRYFFFLLKIAICK